MRVAFIGCGRVSQHYCKIIKSADISGIIEVLAVCDTSQKKSMQLGNKLGAIPTTSFEELLELKLDLQAVFILTPSGKHYAHAKYFLSRGINVVCEKPLTMLPDEALELKSIADSNGVFCCTVFQNRWNSAVQLVKKSMSNGELGRIATVNIRVQWSRLQSYYQDGWHGTWKFDGGVINQQAIHHVDALQWIMGPIKRVCALKSNRANILEAEDTMVALLEFDDGALGTIEATTAARPIDFEASLSIVGSNGKVEIGGIALNRIVCWKLGENFSQESDIVKKFSEEVANGYGLSHAKVISHIAKCVDEKRQPDVSVENSIQSQRLIHSLYLSTEQDRWVYISENAQSALLGK